MIEYWPYISLLAMATLTGLSQVFMKMWSVEISDLIAGKKWVRLVLNARTMLILGLVLIASVLYLLSLRELDLGIAFSFTGLNYFFTILFSRLFLKENVNARNVIGIVLIISGIIVFNN